MLVQSNYDFAVAVAFELIAKVTNKVGSNIVMAIDFTVNHTVNCTIRGVKRLVTVYRQVDDREAAVSKSYRKKITF